MHNRIHRAMDAVHAEEELKNRTKDVLAKRISARKPPAFRRPALALACLALALFVFGGFCFLSTPVSAISVDGNYSWELGLNRLGRVVSVESFSEEGAALAVSAELLHLPCSRALERLLHSDGMQPSWEADGWISVTVIGRNRQDSERLCARIAGENDSGPFRLDCQPGSREDVLPAHEAGMSFGKYQACRRLNALDREITIREAGDLSMGQIGERIGELSDAQSHGQGNGQGKRRDDGSGPGAGQGKQKGGRGR